LRRKKGSRSEVRERRGDCIEVVQSQVIAVELRLDAVLSSEFFERVVK